MRSSQSFWSGCAYSGLRPPQVVSLSDLGGVRISAGQLASSQARVSARNWSRSSLIFPLHSSPGGGGGPPRSGGGGGLPRADRPWRSPPPPLCLPPPPPAGGLTPLT